MHIVDYGDKVVVVHRALDSLLDGSRIVCGISLHSSKVAPMSGGGHQSPAPTDELLAQQSVVEVAPPLQKGRKFWKMPSSRHDAQGLIFQENTAGIIEMLGKVLLVGAQDSDFLILPQVAQMALQLCSCRLLAVSSKTGKSVWSPECIPAWLALRTISICTG